MTAGLFLLIAWWLAPAPAFAEPCPTVDLDNLATGETECLVLRTYRSPGSITAPTLVVFLHGDVSAGGPANYHFRAARRLATESGLSDLVAVGLVRVGYPDGEGRASTGDSYGRSDHYTRHHIGEAAAAITRLKAHHRAARVVLVGHSGGAATAAVILGLRPGLADGAVLFACPCNVEHWRSAAAKRPWTKSESPHAWADNVPLGVRVATLTGSADSNTGSHLAEAYVAQLRRRGVDATFEEVPGATHNSVFGAPQAQDAIVRLVNAVRQ